MAGNLKAFGGFDSSGIHKLDHYAAFLKTFGSDILGYSGFLWIARVVLLVSVVLHIITVIQLAILNKQARPVGYQQEKKSFSEFSASMMKWGGLLLAVFIIFHILHLTIGIVHSDFKEGEVFHNITVAFSNPFMVAFYAIVMFFLALHLYHGVWSVFQTLGVNQPKYNVYFRSTAKAVSMVVSLGFILVPFAILLGFLGQK